MLNRSSRQASGALEWKSKGEEDVVFAHALCEREMVEKPGK